MNILIYESFQMLIRIIEFVILIRVILSWVPLGRDNPIVKIVYALSEPLLHPIRELLKKSPLGGGMMLDFSPIILVLLLQVIQNILFSVLIR